MCLLSLLFLLYTCALSSFFNYPATPQLYTLSLHDALPISAVRRRMEALTVSSFHLQKLDGGFRFTCVVPLANEDRKSTRLNSSHTVISYAVFCLKKKIPAKMDHTCLQAPSYYARYRHTPQT